MATPVSIEDETQKIKDVAEAAHRAATAIVGHTGHLADEMHIANLRNDIVIAKRQLDAVVKLHGADVSHFRVRLDALRKERDDFLTAHPEFRYPKWKFWKHED